jgi:raffinose/stachyose/melibiose transport system substrate-binding protein
VLREYAKSGLVQDLTPALKGDWGNSISKPGLDLYTFDGKTYGVPWDLGMVGFWYNKELFQKAGISAPPKTYAELLDDVRKLQAAGITPIALGDKDKWPGHFYWVYLATRLGGKDAFDKAVSRSGKFTDAPFVEADRPEAVPRRVSRAHLHGPRRVDGQRQGRHGAHGPVGAGRRAQHDRRQAGPG